jgi:hypothetical protein
MNDVEVFRPWSGFAMAGIVFIMSGVLCLQLILGEGVLNSLSVIAWGCAASCLAYLIFVRPKITLFDEGITITNPLVSTTVGWDRVDEIEARYCMSILVSGRPIYAWAAPAPGRYHARTVHSSEIKGLKIGVAGLLRPGESPRTHSGVATHLARLRLEKFRNTAGAQGVESQSRFNALGAATLFVSIFTGLLLGLTHF